MSMAVPTGETKTQPCKVCGVVVEHREFQTLTQDGGNHFSAALHECPQGAACIGGGLRGVRSAYGPLEWQGHTTKGCVRCDTKERS